jgi:PAS domain S-box-containing protein
MSFLFGLLFPMLITLAWGWKYGLLSALCGGCQTMWILWLPGGGYGACVSVPPFILWIVWLGWFSRTKHNIYVGEILFRIFNTALLYTVFRWAFTLNVPPASVGIPLTVVHSMVFKELVNGLLILFIAQALLHSIRVRNFFKLPENQADPRMYYIYLNAVILSGVLIFGFVGEKYIWGMWGPEFQSVARILGSLLLLLIGIFCTYSAANEFAKRKTEELVRAEDRIEHLNLVLRAIRNVNQLITKEKDRDKLLQGACDNLIETRGYNSAWIVLLDESGKLDTAAQAGLGDDFQPMLDRFKHGKLMHCVRLTKEQSGVFVIQDQSSACGDCPLAGKYQGRAGATVRLEYEGKVYGLISVSIPAHVAEDKEEQSLLREVAGDIAFALSSFEVGERRKQAEEELASSEEFLNSVIEQSPVSLWISDSEGTLIKLNQSCRELFGATDEEAVGKYSFFKDNLIEEQGFMPLVENVFEKGEIARFAIDYDLPKVEHVKINGATHRILDVTVSPIKDMHGKVTNAIVQHKDITKLKQAEEALKEYSERLEQMVEKRTKELKDAQDQLVRREKLAILGQLAGGVGHELRNPLGVISNAVYYLKMVQPDADETVKEYLETISEEVNRSTQIVSDLMDFSRIKSVEREETAVSDLISEVLEKQPVPENVKMATTIPSDLPPVFIDLRRIRQVFDNLITNACHAMPEGGKLNISAIAEQDKVHVSFTDTGSGISEVNMEKVFEPLFTTKARGIGLGLAVSRNLVEANGGSIEVESAEDKGSTFTVILPYKEVA